jgi:hypothetical protein
MSNRYRRHVGAIVLVAGSLACVGLAGCTMLGVAAYKLAPDPVIPPVYVLDHEPTLILVENSYNPASMRLQSETICRAVFDDLLANSVAPLVDPQDAADLRHKNPEDYRKMPLDAIGKAVGAKQVIYVDLASFDVSHALASELYTGAAVARVRVVGDNGEVLWPTDAAGGYPVNVKVNPQHTPHGVAEDAIRTQLTAALSEKIGRLFHKWTADSTDGGAEQFQQQPL